MQFIHLLLSLATLAIAVIVLPTISLEIPSDSSKFLADIGGDRDSAAAQVFCGVDECKGCGLC
jgi:hypothetical protein